MTLHYIFQGFAIITLLLTRNVNAYVLGDGSTLCWPYKQGNGATWMALERSNTVPKMCVPGLMKSLFY